MVYERMMRHKYWRPSSLIRKFREADIQVDANTQYSHQTQTNIPNPALPSQGPALPSTPQANRADRRPPRIRIPSRAAASISIIDVRQSCYLTTSTTPDSSVVLFEESVAAQSRAGVRPHSNDLKVCVLIQSKEASSSDRRGEDKTTYSPGNAHVSIGAVTRG